MAGSSPWQRCSTVHPASLAKHPQTWTKEEIGAWLRWCSEEYSIEPISPEKFDLNGKALCLLSRSDFMERVPRNGDVLFNCLQSLIIKHTGGVAQDIVYQRLGGDQRPKTSAIPSISDHMPPAGFLLVPSSSSISSPSSSVCVSTLSCTLPRSSFVPIKPSPYLSVPVRHQQDESLSRQGLLDADPTFSGASSLLEQQSHGNGHNLDSLRQDRSSDCRLLWEFIYQLLQNKKYSNYVCWEDKEAFVFRIINPTGLADLWGQQKNRTNMTYEKLSRALRYYYRMNIIKKVQGKRLTYRFLQPPNSIQKGQRGAKPHYKIQMDLMAGQFSQEPGQSDLDSSRGSSATPVHTASMNSDVKDPDDVEAVSEQGYDSDSAVTEQFDHDSGSSKSSRSSISSPVHRVSADTRQEKSGNASGSATQAKFTSVSPAGASYSDLITYHHSITHQSFSEERYRPYIKYTSPHTLQRDVHYPAPPHSGSSLSGRREIKSGPERLDSREIRDFERNIRYSDPLYRSLSSDFAQSLHVNSFMFRPGQPRSASPTCDVQQEPEDLSTKRGTSYNEKSTNETFRPNSSSFSLRGPDPNPYFVPDRHRTWAISSRDEGLAPTSSFPRDRYKFNPKSVSKYGDSSD